jgi:hypothetical protein
MKFPDGYLWDNPGFPSIMVSYLKTNDFFFSGHCGLPILLLCEYRFLKINYMSLFCIFTFFLEAFTMLSLRGHYSIDVIAGAIFAHYIWDNTNKNIHIIDDLTFNNQKESEIYTINNKTKNHNQMHSQNDYCSKKINEENGDIFIPVRINNCNI